MNVKTKILVRELVNACEEAFAKYPTSCSHSVRHVIRKYIENQPFMTANQLIDQISRSTEWEQVKVDELSHLANEGTLIVGGKKEEDHGHVIVVYPGMEKPKGGYYYHNKTKDKDMIVSEKGSYARAMSTSMGTWPGAMSHGDKTVWDPWGKDATFKAVRFWKYVGPIRRGPSLIVTQKPPKRPVGAQVKKLGKKSGARIKRKDESKWCFKTITDCADGMARKWNKVFK